LWALDVNEHNFLTITDELKQVSSIANNARALVSGAASCATQESVSLGA
jgi:hypothetical protein